MRLEEMNEREGFMKTALQTVDLRLSQLEELSGRVAGALEALAGIDRSELLPGRSRASSEGETTFLLRQGSVHSADSSVGGGGYRFPLPAEEPGPGLGTKRACSFRGKAEKDPGGSWLASDHGQDPPGRARGREETKALPAEQTSDLQNTQLTVRAAAAAAATEAAAPRPPGHTNRPRSGPDEAFGACHTLESTSVVYSHGRRLVGEPGTCGPGVGQAWAAEWKYQVHRITRSRSTDLPPYAVSEAARLAGPEEEEEEEAGGAAAPGVPWTPRPSLAVAEPADTGNLLTVGAGRAPGFPSLRSKSLHGRPGRAPGARARLDTPGHAGSVGSLVGTPKTEATPAETEC